VGYDVDSQFRLHKISYDPEGHKSWDQDKLTEMNHIFFEILQHTFGHKDFLTKPMGREEYTKRFKEWAASWDCSEGEASQQ